MSPSSPTWVRGDHNAEDGLDVEVSIRLPFVDGPSGR